MTLKRLQFLFFGECQKLFSSDGAEALFSSFGVMWMSVSVIDYFAKASRLALFIHGNWRLFLVLGAASTLWRCRPQPAVSLKLKNRDVTITLAIGDVFSFDGAIVIGSNTTFDISSQVISEKSIQGQFTQKYYVGENQLDAEIEAQIRNLQCEELEGERLGKCKRYAIGSVVKLRPKERTGYLLALTDINEHGVSRGTFDNLKQALAELWVFIGDRGSKEALVMPILGSGFTRLPQRREEIAQEIIKSFIAACAEKTFCEDLTIVFRDNDVLDKQIDFDALCDYLKHVCLYTEFSGSTNRSIGTPELQ